MFKMARQSQGGAGGNRAALGNDFGHPSDRHMQVRCQAIVAKLKPFHEISRQNFAGVNGRPLLSDVGISSTHLFDLTGPAFCLDQPIDHRRFLPHKHFLMRIGCWPFLSPRRASEWFPVNHDGGNQPESKRYNFWLPFSLGSARELS